MHNRGRKPAGAGDVREAFPAYSALTRPMTNDQLPVLVWRKGTAIPDRDPAQWRRDVYGNVMFFAAHGDRNDAFGWEIDHIVPVAEGGSNDMMDLRPLHWRANLLR